MGVSGKVWAGVAAILLIGGTGVGALLYASPGLISKAAAPAAEQKSELARFATGPLSRLETPARLEPAPDHVFSGADGADTRLTGFPGKVVLVNTWAMWCVPCRTEMPTLAALASAYADREDFAVIAVNVDSDADAAADARSFLGVNEPLAFYADPAFKLPFLLPGQGKMPQTVLIDRQGRIRAAFSGEADWNGPEARALIEAVLAEG